MSAKKGKRMTRKDLAVTEMMTTMRVKDDENTVTEMRRTMTAKSVGRGGGMTRPTKSEKNDEGSERRGKGKESVNEAETGQAMRATDVDTDHDATDRCPESLTGLSDPTDLIGRPLGMWTWTVND